MKLTISRIFILLLFCGFSLTGFAQEKQYKVVAYFSADSAALQRYDLKKITHLIYSFGHLDSLGLFKVFKAKDTAALHAVAEAKKRYPGLKTMIALGGWTGCFTCSATFNDPAKSEAFAASVKTFLADFKLDGIDLDWEYPTIPGPPGHLYQPQDKENFTALLKTLRKHLGKSKTITFAAGGFMKYLEGAVAWGKLNAYVDFVNLMTYDLVHGYSTESGHQSALYSARPEDESVNKAVNYFKQIKFPLRKIVVGLPFYVRYFQVVDTLNNGLFRSGNFLTMKSYSRYKDSLMAPQYTYYWDKKAQAPYWFDKEQKVFVTGDDKRALLLKSNYVKQQHLGGLMFWELPYDVQADGLLDAIKL